MIQLACGSCGGVVEQTVAVVAVGGTGLLGALSVWALRPWLWIRMWFSKEEA